MVLVIGEILIDLIGKEIENSISFKAKLGGAPFNVATNLNNLGVKTTFIGSIGNDSFGNYILKELGNIKDLKFEINLKKNKQTTLALFIKNSNNEGKFEFIRKYGSDYLFDFRKIEKEMGKTYDIVHFGSLFLSSKDSRNRMFSLLDNFKESKFLKSFDVNIRDDIFSKDEDYKDYYLSMIERMDIVKFTKEEILYLSKKDTLEEAISYFSYLKLIFVTLGKEGSLVSYKNKIYKVKNKEVKVKDSIGAGDSFFSGVLFKLQSKDINNLNSEDLIKILRFANACGAKTCLVDGAINGYKSESEVEQFIYE